MNFPIEIQFRGMPPSDFVYNDVWDHAEKLDQFFNRIVSCHVVVASPHRSKHQGRIYRVQVRLSVPGADVFVSTEPDLRAEHADVYVAVRDAFNAVQRRLEDHVRRMRGRIKERNVAPHGKVVRIFPNEGCGFISTPDGREIYFHENSVLNGDFADLRIGDEVRFSEEMGEKGPQVTSMNRVGSTGHRSFKM